MNGVQDYYGPYFHSVYSSVELAMAAAQKDYDSDPHNYKASLMWRPDNPNDVTSLVASHYVIQFEELDK